MPHFFSYLLKLPRVLFRNRIWSCAGVPLFLGLVRGDIKSMFAYEDHPEKPATAEEDKKDN